jgi:pilus assembly protein CpaB
MDVRRIALALGVALALAAVLTFAVYRRLRGSFGKPQVNQIVAATKAIPAGVAINSADVGLIDWPASVPLPGSFSKVEDVVGHPVIYPLSVNEPILERDLAIPGSGLGLSVKIPPGMRATSVKSDEIVGVAGFLYPGSHVDVLGTFRPQGRNQELQDPVTQTLLQDVEVLASGQTIEPDPQGKPQKVNVVTLMLNPEDSQKMLLAANQGTIQFVLRNGADQTDTKVQPTGLNELIAGVKPPVRPAVRRIVKPKPAVAPPPPVYVMEVIQGAKRSDEKF